MLDDEAMMAVIHEWFNRDSYNVTLEPLESKTMTAAFKTRLENEELASYFISSDNKQVLKKYEEAGSGLYPCMLESNGKYSVAGLCIKTHEKFLGEVMLETTEKDFCKISPTDDRLKFTLYPLSMTKIRSIKDGIVGEDLMAQLEADMDNAYEVFDRLLTADMEAAAEAAGLKGVVGAENEDTVAGAIQEYACSPDLHQNIATNNESTKSYSSLLIGPPEALGAKASLAAENEATIAGLRKELKQAEEKHKAEFEKVQRLQLGLSMATSQKAELEVAKSELKKQLHVAESEIAALRAELGEAAKQHSEALGAKANLAAENEATIAGLRKKLEQAEEKHKAEVEKLKATYTELQEQDDKNFMEAKSDMDRKLKEATDATRKAAEVTLQTHGDLLTANTLRWQLSVKVKELTNAMSELQSAHAKLQHKMRNSEAKIRSLKAKLPPASSCDDRLTYRSQTGRKRRKSYQDTINAVYDTIEEYMRNKLIYCRYHGDSGALYTVPEADAEEAQREEQDWEDIRKSPSRAPDALSLQIITELARRVAKSGRGESFLARQKKKKVEERPTEVTLEQEVASIREAAAALAENGGPEITIRAMIDGNLSGEVDGQPNLGKKIDADLNGGDVAAKPEATKGEEAQIDAELNGGDVAAKPGAQSALGKKADGKKATAQAWPECVIASVSKVEGTEAAPIKRSPMKRETQVEPVAGTKVGRFLVVADDVADGPIAMILSRQDLPILPGSAADKRAGSMKGAYTLVKETAPLESIILAAGSEVYLAVDAAKELGAGCRVVSMPCMELFEAQDAAYKAEVLPNKAITTAVEAGVTAVWYKYADKVLGVDAFGESAPAPLIFEAKGITAANLVATVKA